GFAFIDQGGFRTTASSPASPGVIERFDAAQSTVTGKPTRLVEAPLVPVISSGAASTTGAAGAAGAAGSGAGTGQSFIRTLAPMYDRSAVISLSVSGFTVLPWNYDAAVAPPKISSVVNAADGKL